MFEKRFSFFFLLPSTIILNKYMLILRYRSSNGSGRERDEKAMEFEYNTFDKLCHLEARRHCALLSCNLEQL